MLIRLSDDILHLLPPDARTYQLLGGSMRCQHKKVSQVEMAQQIENKNGLAHNTGIIMTHHCAVKYVARAVIVT
jgi:hypothetical protein